MKKRFSQSFKKQAVEKALGRSEDQSLEGMANTLGIGYSTLQKWIAQSRKQEFGTSPTFMSKEKRPQDWGLEEKLNMVIACAALDDAGIGELCREKGIYPHHVTQWKREFSEGTTGSDKASLQSEAKQLKNEIKTLNKELRRKDKALAETAALLVLQKKVSAIWGNDEDKLQ